MDKAKFIAFYLPQFHVIKENEEIYGKNFTEWCNVRSSKPYFTGHYAPHIPHKSIGYYNLLDKEFIEKQHGIAYNFGIYGFCYYYYNIDGRILLDKPLKIINSNNNIKTRFCLAWCHSSWYDNTSVEKKVFINQTYNLKNIDILVKDVIQYFYNDRYIKVDGKPLFIILSPQNIPNYKVYLSRLRESFSKAGFNEVLIGGIELYGGISSIDIGTDFMIEYAPNWVSDAFVGKINEIKIYDYEKTVRFMIKKPIPNYYRLRCAFPGWDNTPRRKENGIVFINNSPDVFKIHINYLKEYTRMNLPKNLQYIFLNAWNEWGEGCHLEPDMRDDFDYLYAVKEIANKN